MINVIAMMALSAALAINLALGEGVMAFVDVVLIVLNYMAWKSQA